MKSASRKEFPNRSHCKVNSLREPMLLGFFSPNPRLPGFTAQRYKSDSSSKEGRWGSITIFLPFALLPYVLLVSPIKGRNIAARPAWFALLWLNNSKKSHKITQIVQRVGTSICVCGCVYRCETGRGEELSRQPGKPQTTDLTDRCGYSDNYLS